jgi:L,D-transpeptidase YcbB
MIRAICLLGLSAIALASSQLHDLVSSGRLDDLRWPDFSDFQASVDTFYEQSDYSPAWSHDGKISRQAIAIIHEMSQAESNGLNPEDYDASRWAARVANPDFLRFDLALTVSVMRYASDLHLGKFNPGIYHSSFDLYHEHYELAELIRNRLVDTSDVDGVFRELEPPFPGYQRTQTALQRYLALARKDKGELLPLTKLPVRPGTAYSGVRRLAALLGELGDLSPGATVPETYSEAVVDAVKRFQARHGLAADGRIGKSTLAQLNTPLAKRVHQLQLTLERWRWVPHEFTQPPIVVNIPEFELRALNDSYTTALEMKVVVGRAYRRRTPVFAAGMKYVVFRPYWKVPESITRGELLPKVTRDRGYLAANGYEVVTADDQVVTNGVIDDDVLVNLRVGKLSIRQVPGPKNSLGLVKFIFPNEHNVYLHATPATQLFSQSRRDFSHGCIRVEKPELLAQWVLHNNPEWTPARIDRAMQGEKPLQVDLPRPIPVLIVYATAVVLETGEVRFFDDVYGYDAELDKIAAKGYPCRRWNPTSDAPDPRPR